MDEFELEQLRRNPKWTAILEVYHRFSVQSRERSAEFDGWNPRIYEVPEIPNSELPGIHGKLIAHGFLKFDVTSRDAGIRYQLTPLGKQAINAGPPSEMEDSDRQVRVYEEPAIVN